MKKSHKESKPIFQLITFLLKVVKIKGESYFILLMDDEAILELAVGSCLDLVQRKIFPLLPPAERIYCFLSLMCVSVRNHLVKNSKFMMYFWPHFYAVLFYFLIFYFFQRDTDGKKPSHISLFYCCGIFFKFFFYLNFFQFLQVWMSSVKLLEFVVVKKGRDTRV